MPNEKSVELQSERIVLSDETMSRRWKFILDEARVDDSGKGDVAGVVFIFLAFVCLLTLAIVAVAHGG